MSYSSEFRLYWRQLLAASIGMAFGYTLNNYLSNIFIPPLVREFSWARSDVALIGLPAFLSIIFQPLAGRLTDRFGVRAIALFGVTMTPLIYLALSLMKGGFMEFLILSTLQITLVASTTGAVVYSRLIAQNFDHARGMALAIAACSPSLAGIAAPLLAYYITDHGWRSGYRLVAGVTALAGLVALLLIPSTSAIRYGRSGERSVSTMPPRKSATTYKALFGNPAFKYILFGMALCSLSVTVQASQLKFIIENMGVEPSRAAGMISLYAAGVITGRLACGAALDRFPAYVIASVTLGLPGIGLLMIALGMTNPVIMAIAVSLLGLSLGTELDVAGYLIMRYFEVEVYSTALGIVIGTIAISGSIGAIVLSMSLKLTGRYAPFLIACAACAFLGSTLFFMLRKTSPTIHR